MKDSHHAPRTMTIVAFMAMLVIAAAVPVRAADPVAFAFAVTGDPTPGATVTAKATVTINDGSTLQSLTWTQTGGTPVTLSNTTTATVTVALPDRTAYKQGLIKAMSDFPITAAQFPSYVPKPEKFLGGLQNRFGVVGVCSFP